VKFLRKLKFLVAIFVFVAIFAGAFTIFTAPNAEAKRCTWVMYCTVNPPIVCWEQCAEDPPLLPPPLPPLP